ncbi:MAG: histidine kinase dimerization/phospho-acceptor domain-containing protein [Eggerthella lenta]
MPIWRQVRSKTDDHGAQRHAELPEARAEVALDRLGDEAYKNEFFAIVSHELRTPLTSILAYARILNATTA